MYIYPMVLFFYLGNGEHYIQFSEVFGTETTEEYSPSFSAKQKATLANSHWILFKTTASFENVVYFGGWFVL